MDLWSDENLRPFMGVTSHWIQATKIQTSAGVDYKLTLRSDLVGFYNVPGSHTSEHLAVAFLHVLDRIEITDKVCFLSVSCGASNLISNPDWMDNIG